jgi:radical SAM enzyme (TIGR01210 family)
MQNEPVAIWHEKENVGGRIERVLAVVLRTRGCFWAKKAGCLMCGYRNDTSDDVTDEHVLAQVERALAEYNEEEFVKIYTSGSFLDTNEIGAETQKKIIQMFGQRCEHVLVETRAEFAHRALELKSLVQNLEIALGLESANNIVLEKCVRKGIRVENYLDAARHLRTHGIRVRLYLLLKPPFLTEQEAMNDTLTSIIQVADFCDTISINPVNVQRGTYVEHMFIHEEYRPPWFWSLFEVIKSAKSQGISVPVISHPSGSGKSRGIHNCKKCDDKCINALRDYNLSQNVEPLQVDCKCRDVWLAQLQLENALRYSPHIANI